MTRHTPAGVRRASERSDAPTAGCGGARQLPTFAGGRLIQAAAFAGADR